MVRLVDDLLDMSRISTGKIDLRREWAELGAIVHTACESAAPLIERAGQVLELDLPAEPVYLDADPVRLAQVFSNLLNNATKYTERGGRILLAAARREAQVEVSVRDNGIGIPAETLPRVFDMFAQGEGSLEKSHGGLGIGLTIVKRLVELHGGTVHARSDGPGCGSEFIVRLPLLEPTARRRPAASSRALGPQAQRRILVADDNADAALSLAMLLRAMGHEVHTVDDGQAALSRSDTLRPDLIMLDIGMPKMNGYDACKAIRSQRWSVKTQLVALSGWGQEEHKARAREAGFDHYLVKPASLEALERLLASLPAH
jgi:CheY-like chemotaxis protein/anti-sigma regulatory factor (Ser/Thr protein kinase)